MVKTVLSRLGRFQTPCRKSRFPFKSDLCSWLSRWFRRCSGAGCLLALSSGARAMSSAQRSGSSVRVSGGGQCRVERIRNGITHSFQQLLRVGSFSSSLVYSPFDQKIYSRFDRKILSSMPLSNRIHTSLGLLAVTLISLKCLEGSYRDLAIRSDG